MGIEPGAFILLKTAVVKEARPERRIVLCESSNPVTLADAAAGRGVPVRCEAELFLPPEASPATPVPAVVLSHGLAGIKESRERTYARQFAAQGYAALVVDSYSCRGMSKRSDGIRALAVTESMYLADAFAGLSFLAGLPEVQGDRVAVMGFSYGGMVSVLSAYRQMTDLFSKDGTQFAGHIAFYGCSIPRLENYRTTGAPALIVIGEKDRNVCLARSEAIARDMRLGGSDVDHRVMRGAYHQWDGSDTRPRRKVPSLRDMHLTVRPDYEVTGTRGGRMKGYLSRALMIGAGLDPFGYVILKDDEVRAETDRMVSTFLNRHLNDEGASLGEAVEEPQRLAGTA